MIDVVEGTVSEVLSTQTLGYEVDRAAPVTVQFADWWFNVRPSHTEPLLRLNMEANDSSLLDSKLTEIYPLLGTPADQQS